MKSRVLALSLVVICGVAASVQTSAGPLRAKAHWRKNFAQAEAEARQMNRPLLVHFHAKWCGPCKQMEAEVLNSAELQRLMTDQIVAVKVDSDLNPAIVQRFSIQALPSDVLISPTGQVLTKTEGYQAQAQYVATVNYANSQFIASRQVQVAKQDVKPAQPKAPADAKKAAPGPAALATAKPAPKAKPAEKKEIAKATPAKKPAEAAKPAVKLDAPQAVSGLDGYCPVTIWKKRQWKRGQQAYSYEYEGMLYTFVGAAERDEFKKDPTRFAPKLLGCDPVVLSESERAIAGTPKFGAYYDGVLYLFESSETRTRFRNDPHRYIGNRTVLNVKQIQKRKA